MFIAACYIVDHYCFRFDRGVVTACYIVDHYCLRFDRVVVAACYIVEGQQYNKLQSNLKQ
jgi:hypothetical protein